MKKAPHFKTPPNKLMAQQELILIPFIINLVAQHFKIDAGFELLKTRKKEDITHRYVCIYLIGANTKHTSLSKIGEYFNREHSIIVHAKKTISNYLLYDTELRNTVNILQDKIDIKIEGITNDVFDLSDEITHFRINLNHFTSLKIKGCNKYVIGVNFTDAEMEEMEALFNVINRRKHNNTGLYLCEELNPSQNNG